MKYKTLVREGAAAIVEEYRKNGIEAIEKIYSNGGRKTQLNRDEVGLAARYLQSDGVFSDWAFIFIMTRS